MSDDVDVETLLARAGGAQDVSWVAENPDMAAALIARLADALEAVSARPLVADREAVAAEIARWMPGTLQDPDDWQISRGRLIADALFASGVIQSKGDVQAEALEGFAKSLDDEEAVIDIALGGVGHVRHLASIRAAAYRTPASPNSEEVDRD